MIDDAIEAAPPYLRLAEIRIPGRGDGGEITAALRELPTVRADMHARARYLARIKRPWDKKLYHKVRNGGGLYELKWKSGDRQWRVAGFDYEAHFVMVLLFSHKQNVYVPSGWLTIAKKRHREAENDGWDIVKYAF